VRAGDTLSGIAERIDNRPVGLWPAVNAIFETNPDAFLDGDINRLQAGTLLTIPSFQGDAVPQVRQRSERVTAPAMPARPTPVAETYESAAATPPIEDTIDRASQAVSADTAAVAPAAAPPPAPAAEPAFDAPAVVASPEARTEPAEALRPGDIIVGTDAAASRDPVESAEAVTVAPPPRPQTERTAARTAVVRSGNAAGDWSWLVWLVGSGLALVAGVVFFARRYRDGFGSVPVGAPAEPARRRRREEREDAQARLQSLAEDDMDYTVEESGPDAQAFALDADLGIGTGLSNSDDIDVAQDFGFSTTSDLAADLDMMIPEGAEDEPEAQPTDIIEPHLPKMHSILESEILPSSSDDYDLSMIVDATQQTFEDTDVTEKDLFAVPVEAHADNDQSDSYTINDDIGTRLIEQDYEDEHAATQAIDDDIARAALELSDRMDDSSDDTADESGMDLEALFLDLELPDEAALSDLDDTGINAELTADMKATAADADPSDATALMDGNEADGTDVTAEMPVRERADDTGELTARLPGRDPADSGFSEELTAEMSRAENDSTVEMDIESGRVNTKKRIG